MPNSLRVGMRLSTADSEHAVANDVVQADLSEAF